MPLRPARATRPGKRRRKWETRPSANPACSHPGRDPPVPLGAHAHDIYPVGIAGKGLWIIVEGGKGEATMVSS